MKNTSIFILVLLVMIVSSSAQICQSVCKNCKVNNTCTQCISEFIIFQKKCIRCIKNCELCQANNATKTTCLTCSQGYQKSSDGSRCFKCSQLCLTCSQYPENCISCKNGELVKLGNSSLNTCKIQSNCSKSCSKCDSAGVCQKCSEGTGFIGTNCESCTNYCTNCSNSSSSICSGCISGYLLNSISAQCQVANSLNCNAWQPILNRCKSCSTGYYLDSEFNCAPCIYPTIECLSSNQSIACSITTTLHNSECVRCDTTCLTCLGNTSTCLTCRMPYSYFPNFNGICYRCFDILCRTCQQKNSSLCLECISGATLGKKSCLLCPDRCELCFQVQYSIECSRCAIRNTLKNGKCVSCSQFCLECSTIDSKLCLTCDKGFYNINGQCYKCQRGCQQCVNNITCQKATRGWGLTFNNTLLEIGSQGCAAISNISQLGISNYYYSCKLCMPGYFPTSKIDDDNFYCIKCGIGCIQCFNQTSCQVCDQRLYQINGSCLGCSAQNCLECESSDTTSCLKCNNGYVFVLNSNSCQKCADNCNQCEKDYVQICFIAADGFTVNMNGKVIPCLSNCSGTCDPNDLQICLSCSKGFELRQNICVQCPTGCLQCLQGLCYRCHDRYQLIQSNGIIKCSLKCQKFCQICIQGKCDTWNQKYSNSSHILQALDDQLQCPKGCLNCDSSKRCFSCQIGLYLKNQTSCDKCPQNCFQCLDENTCSICKLGYARKVNIESNGYIYSQCEKCNQFCQTCIQPNKCTSCNQGYKLIGVTCITQKTVNLKLKISGAFGLFLQRGSIADIIDWIATQSQIETPFVFIDIMQGSIIIKFAFDTTYDLILEKQDIKLKTLVQSITKALVDFPSQFPIIQSAITTDQAIETEKIDQKVLNILEIIGIVVAGGLFLLLIVIIIYSSRKKQEQKKQLALKVTPITIKQIQQQIQISGYPQKNDSIFDLDSSKINSLTQIKTDKKSTRKKKK